MTGITEAIRSRLSALKDELAPTTHKMLIRPEALE